MFEMQGFYRMLREYLLGSLMPVFHTLPVTYINIINSMNLVFWKIKFEGEIFSVL